MTEGECASKVVVRTAFSRGREHRLRVASAFPFSVGARVCRRLRVNPREKDALGLGKLVFEQMRDANLHLDHVGLPAAHFVRECFLSEFVLVLMPRRAHGRTGHAGGWDGPLGHCVPGPAGTGRAAEILRWPTAETDGRRPEATEARKRRG